MSNLMSYVVDLCMAAAVPGNIKEVAEANELLCAAKRTLSTWTPGAKIEHALMAARVIATHKICTGTRRLSSLAELIEEPNSRVFAAALADDRCMCSDDMPESEKDQVLAGGAILAKKGQKGPSCGQDVLVQYVLTMLLQLNQKRGSQSHLPLLLLLLLPPEAEDENDSATADNAISEMALKMHPPSSDIN